MRSGSCWDSGPDACPGCTYCDEARHTSPDEPVYYPDEQATRDADQAQRRLNVAAATSGLRTNPNDFQEQP